MKNKTRTVKRTRTIKTRTIKVKHFRRLLEYYLERSDLDKGATLGALLKLFNSLPEEKVIFAWNELKRTKYDPCCPQWPYLCDANCQDESARYPFGE